jgi:alpha-1,6-mannosyltransferase
MLLPFMLAAWVSVHSVLLAIVALKAMWLLTHACTCAVLYRMLKGWRGDPAFGLFLVAMNPLILLEQITNGHNDGLMTLAGLLAVWAVQRERFVAGLLLALLAALVKLPGAFFGAAILVYLVRRGEWRRAAVGVAACVALTIPVAIILFPDVDAVRPTTLSGFYLTNSFHVLSLEGLSRHGARWGVQTGIEDLFAADRAISLILLVAFAAWRSLHIRNIDSLVRELAYLFLALLIGYTAWFFPWYVTWVVPLAALVSSARLRRAIVAYSWSVLALYAFPRVMLDEIPFHAVAEVVRILIAHAVPLLVLFRVSRSPGGAGEIRHGIGAVR